MIDQLLAFLSGDEMPRTSDDADDLKIAVAALLIEAGRMDSRFDAAERVTIERLLAQRFELGADQVRSLVEAAEQKIDKSAQYYPFTREITKRLSREQKAEIIEMLWKVAYADGTLDPYEDALLRQISGLIHVDDRDRGLARLRALESLEKKS